MKASFLCYRFSLFLQSPCVSNDTVSLYSSSSCLGNSWGGYHKYNYLAIRHCWRCKHSIWCSAVFIIFGISGCFAYGWTTWNQLRGDVDKLKPTSLRGQTTETRYAWTCPGSFRLAEIRFSKGLWQQPFLQWLSAIVLRTLSKRGCM